MDSALNTQITITDCLAKIGMARIIDAIFRDLKVTPKRIASIYFYDARGSQLFEEITHLPEYYLTRTEKGLLKQIAPRLGQDLQDRDIVEIGSGNCAKISILLDAIPPQVVKSVRYIPVDVSSAALKAAARQLVKGFPGLRVRGLVADFSKQLHLIPDTAQRLICFLGSTLGNLDPEQARQFFITLGEIMPARDRFLLGIDLIKSRAVLEQAYNDQQGVTAAFNRNILTAINNLAGTDFDPQAFRHVAFYNKEACRIEMHLEARRDMVITSPRFPHDIELVKGEMIHTENSYKFTPDRIATLAETGGMFIENIISDADDRFALLELGKAG